MEFIINPNTTKIIAISEVDKPIIVFIPLSNSIFWASLNILVHRSIKIMLQIKIKYGIEQVISALNFSENNAYSSPYFWIQELGFWNAMYGARNVNLKNEYIKSNRWTAKKSNAAVISITELEKTLQLLNMVKRRELHRTLR